MSRDRLHRFEHDGKRFALDTETCFCFECDAISWDVLEFYPEATPEAIYQLLGGKYDRAELAEVLGELDWLRATKSILAEPKREDMLKVYEVERGLKRLTLALPREETAKAQTRKSWFGRRGAVTPAPAIAAGAISLLLTRSEAQKELRLEFVEHQAIADPDLIAECGAQAVKAAKLAGKQLMCAVCVADVTVARPPAALEGHRVSVRLEFKDADMLPHVRALAKANGATLARLAKVIQPAAEGVTGQIVVCPGHPKFGGVVEALDQAGFANIELDLDGAYVANPKLEPLTMLDGLSQSAVYYAQQLLERHYFRLDPIASLFWHVYSGSPRRRSDPVGTNEFAVDAAGAIYPCWKMAGIESLRLGSLADGVIDEEKVRRFDDVGSLTTADCIRCWVRNLCGGGTAAVHRALTGSFRTPYTPWCDGQRSWMAAAVSAFQMLSSQGVQFDRLYKTLGRSEKPSLFTLARAALTMTIGVRPIEEADAPLLIQWENWNEAAYFLFNESGVMLATQYDREMDALHPSPTEQELVLIRKNGESFGLFKMRPDRIPGVARAWIYMRDESDYASDAVRKGFRAILKEAGALQAVKRLTVPVSPKEQGLRAFLEAVGFASEGVLREALYLHGAHHDVTLYSITTERL